MSFNTKLSMWWGSVTTKTEKMFNKEKQRIVTHEYYDNPNAKAARPKSMRSIRGSMRMQNSARSNQASDEDAEPRQRSSSKRSSRNKHEQEDNSGYDGKGMPQNDYQSAPQDQYPQEMGDGMPQSDQYMQQQMAMQNQQYDQQQYMQDEQYAQEQPMQGGYPNQGYANQGYAQGYWRLSHSRKLGQVRPARCT